MLGPHMRVVSLLSSATETVCALGLEKYLVGISHECDYPESIRHLPVVSKARLNPLAPADLINSQVEDSINRGLSLYQVDTELLAKLKPDVILTQDQCEVCAVSLKDVESAVCKVTGIQSKIVTLHPFALDDICKTFRQIGEALGAKEAAEDLVTRFWIQLNQVNARAGTHLKYRPKVLLLEWLDPLIVAGSWLPELCILAGADPLLISEPEHFKKVKFEEIKDLKPDRVIILPCGWDLKRTQEEMNLPKIQKQLSQLGAPIYACDGNAFFNRPGPRIAESLEIFGAIIFPEKFPDLVKKHEGVHFARSG